MSSDASTLPLRHPLLGDAVGAGRQEVSSEHERATTRLAVVLGVASLLTILVGCALIVVVSANRPTFPPTHAHFFPGWLAGPLGGASALVPRRQRTGALPLYALARGHVRGLSAGTALRAAPAAALDDRRPGGGAGAALALAAAGAHRHLQLCQLRADGDRAPSQPLHDDPHLRAAQRPQLRPEQLAPPAEPLRPAVHAHHLRACAPGRRGLFLGDQADSDDRQPGHSVAGVEVCAPAGARAGAGDRLRRPQPGGARVGPRRRPQRLRHDVLS